ncbi:hypothetical protein MAQ5080_01964 [Marinomonas aquimarina]|uniref:DUF1127 domain-containing protein n=1 Tax=Marinomonas aquimarina TaxID=295068 RepID=A0A1A8TFU2_9GAMM|nr:hypothetical protein [Marinomonas aquimarina]SBS31410.1 hypothetical protein MAQ5080_01964 [Marinomonas aquimarina]
MSFIALLNIAKEYFEQRRLNQTFGHLEDHVLRDVGFVRTASGIRPLKPTREE